MYVDSMVRHVGILHRSDAWVGNHLRDLAHMVLEVKILLYILINKPKVLHFHCM